MAKYFRYSPLWKKYLAGSLTDPISVHQLDVFSNNAKLLGTVAIMQNAKWQALEKLIPAPMRQQKQQMILTRVRDSKSRNPLWNQQEYNLERAIAAFMRTQTPKTTFVPTPQTAHNFLVNYLVSIPKHNQEHYDYLSGILKSNSFDEMDMRILLNAYSSPKDIYFAIDNFRFLKLEEQIELADFSLASLTQNQDLKSKNSQLVDLMDMIVATNLYRLDLRYVERFIKMCLDRAAEYSGSNVPLRTIIRYTSHVIFSQQSAQEKQQRLAQLANINLFRNAEETTSTIKRLLHELRIRQLFEKWRLNHSSAKTNLKEIEARQSYYNFWFIKQILQSASTDLACLETTDPGIIVELWKQVHLLKMRMQKLENSHTALVNRIFEKSVRMFSYQILSRLTKRIDKLILSMTLDDLILSGKVLGSLKHKQFAKRIKQQLGGLAAEHPKLYEYQLNTDDSGLKIEDHMRWLTRLNTLSERCQIQCLRELSANPSPAISSSSLINRTIQSLDEKRVLCDPKNSSSLEEYLQKFTFFSRFKHLSVLNPKNVLDLVTFAGSLDKNHSLEHLDEHKREVLKTLGEVWRQIPKKNDPEALQKFWKAEAYFF